ncbi:hypothetical protein ABC974_08685 [Sphingomonas oligophenolica]|uniref:Uncharacterized protein n=1 Tax=Sphingomonas oligophenolica TaxID=301154 RepID=A0ABU9Y1N7_9SPHN
MKRKSVAAAFAPSIKARNPIVSHHVVGHDLKFVAGRKSLLEILPRHRTRLIRRLRSDANRETLSNPRMAYIDIDVQIYMNINVNIAEEIP